MGKKGMKNMYISVNVDSLCLSFSLKVKHWSFGTMEIFV